MNSSKNQLMDQINKIMQDNKPSVQKVSKADREIAYYESELLSNNIGFPFNQMVSELAPELSDESFGSGKFKRNEYLLTWDKDDSGKFRLALTNIPHSHKKLLSDCPVEFKNDIYLLLPRFIENIAAEAKKMMSSDN